MPVGTGLRLSTLRVSTSTNNVEHDNLLVRIEDLNLVACRIFDARSCSRHICFISPAYRVTAGSFEHGSQSAFGLLPDTKTVPSGSSVADEWYIRGMVEVPALDHFCPEGLVESKYLCMSARLERGRKVTYQAVYCGLSAYDCPTAQLSFPYPAVPVLAPLRSNSRPSGKLMNCQ